MDKDFEKVVELAKEIKKIIQKHPDIISVAISKHGSSSCNFILTGKELEGLSYENMESSLPGVILRVSDLGSGIVTQTIVEEE